MEERVAYALKNFFTDKFTYEANQLFYELLETDKYGKSKLLVNVSGSENICVKNFDDTSKWGIINGNKKLSLNKCVDHFIFQKNSEGFWELHVFEMKTTVGFRTWQNIQYKMRPSYLRIKALAIYLGIPITDANITVYTTYEQDKFTSQPYLPKLGYRVFDVKSEEWDADCIRVPMIVSEDNPFDFKTFIPLHHKKIKMQRSNDDILEGEISL